MNYINYIPPIDVYYVIQEGLQMEDIAFQYGDIKKIIDFDSVPKIRRVNMSLEVDAITQDLPTVSIVDDKRKYNEHYPEQICQSCCNARRRGTSASKT
jgi:hypothetical protein